MPDFAEIMDALAGQLQSELCGTVDPVIEFLQVEGRMLFNPSPPSLDVYPANPAMTPLAYGGSREMFITVRCRVSNADSEGGQDLLLSMMDPEATTSVAAALLSDPTLGGKCDDLSVDGPSGYGTFPPDGSNLLGCTWDVRILPS